MLKRIIGTMMQSVTAKIAQDQVTSLRAVLGLVETRFIPILLRMMPRSPIGKAKNIAIVPSTNAKAIPMRVISPSARSPSGGVGLGAMVATAGGLYAVSSK